MIRSITSFSGASPPVPGERLPDPGIRRSHRDLDRVDAGAPIRLQLASVYWDVCEDAEKAKAVIVEILESNSTGWPWRFTNEELQTTLVDALLDAESDIINEEFRATGDRERKLQLLQ